MRAVKWYMILGVGLLLGCQPVSYQLEIPDYLQWVKEDDHSWRQTKEVGDYRVEVLLHPPEYQLLQEYAGAVMSAVTWDSITQVPPTYQYATLRIGSADEQTPLLRKNTEDAFSYQARVQYLAFELQQALTLRSDSSNNPCVLYHFERSFDLAPFVTCMIAFPAPVDAESDWTIRWEDNHFGMGPLQFRFPASRNAQQPTVKIPAHASAI